jgi:hypothetical protein
LQGLRRTLKVAASLLCGAYFVRLLCTLEVLASLLCEACFVHIFIGRLYSSTLRGLLRTLELLASLLGKAYFARLLCTLETLASLLCEASFERLEFCMLNLLCEVFFICSLNSAPLYMLTWQGSARLTLHTLSLGELTMRRSTEPIHTALTS